MKSLQVDQLSAFVQGEPGTVLLDVREPWEVALAAIHLPGTQALHIPMTQVPQRLGEIDEERPVVCICHHGGRSAQVVAFLMQRGYSRLYNLAGGIDAWSTHVDASVPRY